MKEPIRLRGSYKEIGYQLGHSLTSDETIFKLLVNFMEKEVETAKSYFTSKKFSEFKKEFGLLLKKFSPATTNLIAGIAEGSELSRQKLLSFHIAPYFKDKAKIKEGKIWPNLGGCSTLAIADSPVGPILAKNRDNNPDFLPLQIILKAFPKKRYGYLGVSTWAIAGIHSSGINEKGLAIADTHVYSKDIGMGLPRYVIEREILERCSTVLEAIDLIDELPIMGRGNLILADSKGEIAVAELGHEVQGIRRAKEGFLVTTNHFIEDSLKNSFVDVQKAPYQGNTFARYEKIQNALATNSVNSIEDCKNLLSSHDGRSKSLCRHSDQDTKSRTISSSIILPKAQELFFIFGYPCRGVVNKKYSLKPLFP